MRQQSAEQTERLELDLARDPGEVRQQMHPLRHCSQPGPLRWNIRPGASLLACRVPRHKRNQISPLRDPQQHLQKSLLTWQRLPGEREALLAGTLHHRERLQHR
jgi:hypothetical protein